MSLFNGCDKEINVLYMQGVLLENRKYRFLQNYPTLFEYVLKSKLIDLPTHNSCYMRFFDLKKNDKSDKKQNKEDSITDKVDIGVNVI